MKKFYIKQIQSGDRVYHLNFLRLALVLLILIALITVIVLAVNIAKTRAKKAEAAEQARIQAEEDQKKADEEAAQERQRQEEAARAALEEAEKKAQAEEEATRPQVEARAIVIDPGHGGEDDGVTKEDILEKDINLVIAKMVQQKLTEAGYTVVMTRTGDETVSREDRVANANNLHADLFVSIHQNMMSSDSSVRGAETWFSEDSEKAKELARDVQENLILQTDAKDRGIKSGQEMYITENTQMPAVILECGFLSNEEECALLTSTEYQQKVAQGIADGIIQFLEEADLPASQYQF